MQTTFEMPAEGEAQSQEDGDGIGHEDPLIGNFFEGLPRAVVEFCQQKAGEPEGRETIRSLARISGIDPEGNISDAFRLVPLLWQWIWAYRNVLRNAHRVISNPIRAQEFVDGREVALASKDIGELTFYPIMRQALFEGPASRMLEIGAGSAQLTIEFLQRNSEATAVAIDRSAEACEEARIAAEQADVQSRMSVSEIDAIDLTQHPEMTSGCDRIAVGFALHDVLAAHGESQFVSLLQTISRNMRAKGCMVVGEAVHAEAASSWFQKIFTFVHEIQGIELPTQERWIQLFRRGGFEVQICRGGRMDGSKVFELRPKHRNRGHATVDVPILRELDGHNKPVPFYLTPEVIADSPIDVACVDLGKIPRDGPAEPHTHERKEVYFLPPYNPPIEIEVTIEQHRFVVSSPAVVEIPAGERHSFQVREAEEGQFIFGIFWKGDEK